MADKPFDVITDADELDGTETMVILQGANSRELDIDKLARWSRGSNINDQSGTGYTAVLTDLGGTIRMSNAAANTVTIPPNSTTIMAIGTRIRVTQIGAGTTTIVEGSGVTINTSDTLVLGTQWMTGVLIKVDTDVWDLDKTGGGTAGDLDSMSDVDLTTTAERKNDRVVYDGTNWVPVGASILRLSAKAESHTNNTTRPIAWTEVEDTDSYFGGGTVADEHMVIPFTGRYRIKVKISFSSVTHTRFIAQMAIRLNRTGTTFNNDFPNGRFDLAFDMTSSNIHAIYQNAVAIIDVTVSDELDIISYHFAGTNRSYEVESFVTLEYMGPTP